MPRHATPLAIAVLAALAGAACSNTITGKGKATAPACAGPIVPYMPEEWEKSDNDLPAASPASRRARGEAS